MVTIGDELFSLPCKILAEIDLYSEGVQTFSSSNIIPSLFDFHLPWNGVILFPATNHCMTFLSWKGVRKETFLDHSSQYDLLYCTNKTILWESLTVFKTIIQRLDCGYFYGMFQPHNIKLCFCICLFFLYMYAHIFKMFELQTLRNYSEPSRSEATVFLRISRI